VEFSVQATLSYRVQQETPFVFNVQAQAFAGQTIKSESSRIEPDMPTEVWTMPESANRYFRLITPAGGFKITYKATVLLGHPTENPDAAREQSWPRCACWLPSTGNVTFAIKAVQLLISQHNT
jgi:hypothetical protein